MNLLEPKKLNRMQRIGYFGAIAIVMILLFLHYPFDGYRTPCLEHSYEHGFIGCKKYDDSISSILDWKSDGSLINWISYIKNLLSSIGFVLAMAFLWLHAFKEHEVKESRL